MLNFAAITPHPPIIIPSIGQKQALFAKKTIKAMQDLADNLKKIKPETIIIVSPHGPMRYDKFTINVEDLLKGSFENFGDQSDEKYYFKGNPQLAKSILQHLKKEHFPVEVVRERDLDHGALVPLYYLCKPLEEKPKIINVTFTALDLNTHYLLGQKIGAILQKTEENIAFIASGDLSHRLTDDAPAGFSPYGKKFDRTLIELLKKNDAEKILNLNPEFCSEAGECGLRSITIALGALSDLKLIFQQLSYEAPFGVGYLVGQWKIR